MFLEETIATCKKCGGRGAEIPGSGLGTEPFPVVTYRCITCGHLSNDPPNGSSFTYGYKTLFWTSIFYPLIDWWRRHGA